MATETERLLDFCRKLPGTTEDVKWGNDLVFSVGGKMYAASDLPDHEAISFKVDPTVFPVLTQQPGVMPAPYLAHHSWVKVTSGAMSREELEDLIRESHAIVAQKLSKKMRASLGLG